MAEDEPSKPLNNEWDKFAFGRSHSNSWNNNFLDSNNDYKAINEEPEDNSDIGPYVSAESEPNVYGRCESLNHNGIIPNTNIYAITSVDNDLLKEIDDEIVPYNSSPVYQSNGNNIWLENQLKSPPSTMSAGNIQNLNETEVVDRNKNTYGTVSRTENGIIEYHDDSDSTDGHMERQVFGDNVQADDAGGSGITSNNWHCHDGEKTEVDKLARNQLVGVCALCILFMIGEAIGGALSNSLALFTDVLHLASDLTSFIISVLAIYLSGKPATKRMSFGYHRAEVLGALCSVFIIWLVSGILCYIAVERILRQHYKDVKPDEMLITAVLGVVFNIIMGFVLHSERCCRRSKALHKSFGHGHSHGHGHGHSHNHGHSNRSRGHNDRDKIAYEPLVVENGDSELQNGDSELQPYGIEEETEVPHRHKNINVRAAFIHVIGDIIQSVGVLVASLIIKLRPEEEFRLADPICTFLFSVLVLFTTILVLRDAIVVIMEEAIETELREACGVHRSISWIYVLFMILFSPSVPPSLVSVGFNILCTGVPRDVNYQKVREDLQNIEGVIKAHSLCIWSFTIDRNALSVHLAKDSSHSHQAVLEKASKMLKNKHKFFHITIQVEDFVPALMNSCRSCQGPTK